MVATTKKVTEFLYMNRNAVDGVGACGNIRMCLQIAVCH